MKTTDLYTATEMNAFGSLPGQWTWPRADGCRPGALTRHPCDAQGIMALRISSAMTAAIPIPAAWAAWFRNTKTRLCAVAISLAILTPVFGQPVITAQPQWQTNIAGTTAAF